MRACQAIEKVDLRKQQKYIHCTEKGSLTCPIWRMLNNLIAVEVLWKKPICFEGCTSGTMSSTSNPLASKHACHKLVYVCFEMLNLPHAWRKASTVASLRTVAEIKTSTPGCSSKSSLRVAVSAGMFAVS